MRYRSLVFMVVLLLACLALQLRLGAQPAPPTTAPATAPTTGPAPLPSTQRVDPWAGYPWIVSHLYKGGPIVLIQLLVSVIGLAVVLERFMSLRRSTIIPEKLASVAEQKLAAGEYADLKKIADRDSSALARVLSALAAHPNLPAPDRSALAGDVASRELRRQISRCYLLALVATVEPLLGLFGTVVGMIGAFEAVAVAGSLGDPSILADSISVALITTEVGLAIAIPALFVYQVLRNRIQTLGIELEERLTDLLLLAQRSKE